MFLDIGYSLAGQGISRSFSGREWETFRCGASENRRKV